MNNKKFIIGFLAEQRLGMSLYNLCNFRRLKK